MEKIKIFDYEVSFLRAENARGYIEAQTAEEAKERMTAEAQKQGLINFKVRSLKEEVIELPENDSEGLVNAASSKTFN